MGIGKGALAAGRHWTLLSPAERRELQLLLRKSRGRPWQLNPRERATFWRLVAKLELRTLGRDLAALASPLPWPRGSKRQHR
jgi:hypothetical protein